MELKPKANCPLNGFQPCKQLDCAWFTQLRGVDPGSGKDVDEWGCAVAWLPMLLVENSQQSRQTGAAVESFRNAMREDNERSMNVLLNAARERAGRLTQ